MKDTLLDHRKTTSDGGSSTWINACDNVSEYETSIAGSHYTEQPTIDPDTDLSLVRADQNKLVNSLFSYAMTKATKQAEQMAADQIALDGDRIRNWLQEGIPEPVAENPPVADTEEGIAASESVGDDAADDRRLRVEDLDDSLTNLALNASEIDQQVSKRNPVNTRDSSTNTNSKVDSSTNTTDSSSNSDDGTTMSTTSESSFPPTSDEDSVATGIAAAATTKSDTVDTETTKEKVQVPDTKEGKALDESIPWEDYEAPAVPDVSIPWEDYEPPEVSEESLPGHQVLLNDSDVEFDPEQSFGRPGPSRLRPCEKADVLFYSDLEGRLRIFRQTGAHDQLLIDQLTQG